MRWTRKGIIEEIKRLQAAGAALNYAAAQAEHLNLVRAASWHFGTWRQAVEKAGIPYEDISKYRRWNRERIIARVRELHEAGADLSWRTISTQTDPPLAAAALRSNGFGSWREAIAAAGLDIGLLARYRHWDQERVKSEIRALHRARAPLSSRSVQFANQPLFCAARRRFGSWDAALEHAGFNAREIRLRRSAHQSSATVLHAGEKSPQTIPDARATRQMNSNGHSLVDSTPSPTQKRENAKKKPSLELENERAKSAQEAASPKAISAAEVAAQNTPKRRIARTGKAMQKADEKTQVLEAPATATAASDARAHEKRVVRVDSRKPTAASKRRSPAQSNK